MITLSADTDGISRNLEAQMNALEVPAAPLEPLTSWIPLTTLEKMAQADYDVLIVGSGAGGGAALWRLCEQWRNNGKRVGMIEAGGLLLPTHGRNLTILSGGRRDRYILGPSVTKRIGLTLPEFSGAKQIFALGGRTIQWGAVCPRVPLYLLANWPLAINEMQFYYSIAEQIMNVTKAFVQGGALQQILLNKLWVHGISDATNYPMAVDIQPTQFGEIHSNTYFSSIIFLAEALNHRPFDLAVQARAVQVYTENGKAAGVKVMSPDKKTYILRAKTIVLSTSTLETPRLLLHSGIQGRAIGHYLIDQSSLRALATLRRDQFPDVLGRLGILIPETEEHPYQLQVSRIVLPIENENEIRTQILSFGSVESRFENKVFLDPSRRDEYGVPRIQVNYSYTPKDLSVIRQTAAGVKQVFSNMGAVPLSLEGTPEICLRPPGDDNHEAGTCRMGDDPLTSAVDRFGQIHGISGLYVADNSVLPSLGANPTLSTVALAIRTADHIIKRLK